MGAVETPNRVWASGYFQPVLAPPFTNRVLEAKGITKFTRVSAGQYLIDLQLPLAFMDGKATASVSVNFQAVASAQICNEGRQVLISVLSIATGAAVDPPFVGVVVWAIREGEGSSPDIPCPPPPPPIPGAVNTPFLTLLPALAQYSPVIGIAPAFADQANEHNLAAFTAANPTQIVFPGVMPTEYDPTKDGLLSLYWSSSVIVGAVFWRARWERNEVGHNLDANTFAAPVGDLDPAPAAVRDVEVLLLTFTNAQMDAIAQGDPFRLMVERDTDNAGDDMAAPAQLLVASFDQV